MVEAASGTQRLLPWLAMTELAGLTTLRLGGPARELVVAETEEALLAAVRAAAPPLLVLAGGSNVVVADAGFPGTVVLVATRGVDGARVAAGEPWDPFVARCVAQGRAGVEALSGIPGSVGATPIQNVGAYGQEVGDVVTLVRAYDRTEDRVVALDREACGFGYRTSRFKREPGRYVVLSVDFGGLEESAWSRPVAYAELARALGVEVGARVPLADVREAVLGLRRRKGMVVADDDPDSVSAGSFFTNPVLSEEEFARLAERAGDGLPRYPAGDGRVKTSAAWLIERAGFTKGHGDPVRVAISSKHTLALTNRGAGTTTDLVALAREIAHGVEERFGVRLEPEPLFVGHEW
jgi:UDP-N-acetylmuramate dehydrogenase